MGIRKTAFAILFMLLTLLGGAGASWREEDLSPEATVIMQDGAAYGEEAPKEDTGDMQNIQITGLDEKSLTDEKKKSEVSETRKDSAADSKKGGASASVGKTETGYSSETEGGSIAGNHTSAAVSDAVNTAQETPLRPAGEQTDETGSRQPAQEVSQESKTESAAHVHVWQTETVTHEELSHTVHHEAEIEQRWVSVPVVTVTYCCDVCGAEFATQDAAYAHENATYQRALESGDMSLIHSGHYSRTVTEDCGHYETVVIMDAYDEKVVDEPAWEEKITRCIGCGAEG